MYSRKISRKLNNFESRSPRNSRGSIKRNCESESDSDSISGSDSYFDSDESLSEDDEREVSQGIVGEIYQNKYKYCS